MGFGFNPITGEKELLINGYKRGAVEFWLKTKRKDKTYSQQFKSEFVGKGICYDRLLFHKLRELLVMLERTIEHGYLYEPKGTYLSEHKLTKTI
jgi:hypothetical protein